MKKKLNGKDPYNFLVIPKPVMRFVVPANMKVGGCKALDDILMLFGPGGKNWIKGEEHEHYAAGETREVGRQVTVLTKAFDGFCLIGGVKKVDGAYEGIARVALALAIAQYDKATAKRLGAYQDPDEIKDQLVDEGVVTNFNDAKKVKFADICKVVILAKKLVRAADIE